MKIRKSPFFRGEDPLDLVDERALVKALKKYTEIDGKEIRKILEKKNQNLNPKDYLLQDFIKTHKKGPKSLKKVTDNLDNILKENPEIFNAEETRKAEPLEKSHNYETKRPVISPMLREDEIKFLKKLKNRLEKEKEFINNLKMGSGKGYFVKTERQNIAVSVNKLYAYLEKKTKYLNENHGQHYPDIEIYELIADLLNLEDSYSSKYDKMEIKKIHDDYPEISFPTVKPFT